MPRSFSPDADPPGDLRPPPFCSLASRAVDGAGGHVLVDVVRIACDGCELDALTTSDATRALKERVKQLLLETRYEPGTAPFVVSATSRGGEASFSSSSLSPSS